MHSIITEELRFRKRVCEYAIKHGNNAEAARRYHTSRQQVQRWVKRFDGTINSLRLYSRKPHSHPNQHTEEELILMQIHVRMYRYRYLRSNPYGHCCISINISTKKAYVCRLFLFLLI